MVEERRPYDTYDEHLFCNNDPFLARKEDRELANVAAGPIWRDQIPRFKPAEPTMPEPPRYFLGNHVRWVNIDSQSPNIRNLYIGDVACSLIVARTAVTSSDCDEAVVDQLPDGYAFKTFSFEQFGDRVSIASTVISWDQNMSVDNVGQRNSDRSFRESSSEVLLDMISKFVVDFCCSQAGCRVRLKSGPAVLVDPAGLRIQEYNVVHER